MHPALQSPAMAGIGKKILNLLHWEPLSVLKLRAWGRWSYIVTSTLYFLLTVNHLSMKNTCMLRTTGWAIKGLNACNFADIVGDVPVYINWETGHVERLTCLLPACEIVDIHPLLWSSKFERRIVSEMWMFNTYLFLPTMSCTSEETLFPFILILCCVQAS